jgi:hypothetical protein
MKGWRGILFDGEFSNDEINLRKEFIIPSTVGDVFKKYNVPKDVDYISVDIDSCDVFVLEAILSARYRPRVVTIEYNCMIDIHAPITNLGYNRYENTDLYKFTGMDHMCKSYD